MAKKVKDPLEVEEFGADIDAEDQVLVTAGADMEIELTEDEKRKLEDEARKEVLAALKAAKMKDFKNAAKKRLHAQALFRDGKDEAGEDLVTVHLQLASYPKWISLDGTRYFSGRTYTVGRNKAAVLLEQMDRGWRQEAARKGEDPEIYIQQTQRVVNSRNGLFETRVQQGKRVAV